MEFIGTLTSTHCPYCGSPVQLEKAHKCEENRIHVDGVLPFQIERNHAEQNLKQWVESRWFAPNSFRKQGAAGKFNGVYLSYFTFDAMTLTEYTGSARGLLLCHSWHRQEQTSTASYAMAISEWSISAVL